MADPNEIPPAHKSTTADFKKGLGCMAILAAMLVIGSIINWVNDTPAKRAERAAVEAKRSQEQAAMRKLEAERKAAEEREKQAERRKYAAIAMAKEFVTRRLKAPKSAEFPWPSAFKVVASGDEYLVSGYVDSQNSFGAMIRSNFLCQMKVSGEEWTLVDVAIK